MPRHNHRPPAMNQMQAWREGEEIMDKITKLHSMFPRGSADFFKANETKTRSKLPDPKPKHYEATALGRAVPGKTKSVERVKVRYRLFRVRPLDFENFAGSTKDCTDGLCRCGLLPGDDPTRLSLTVEQEKVAHFADERTEIEIEWPEDKT